MLNVQTIYQNERAEMKEALDSIVLNANTTNAILITQDGQYVMSSGEVSFINTTALAALVAGMFTATREVAKLLGELEFSILFQQGMKRNIHISLINRDLMLLVVFEGVEKTGVVRMNTAQYGKRLAELVSYQDEEVKKEGSMPSPASINEAVNAGAPETRQPLKENVAVSAPAGPKQQAGSGGEDGLDAFKEYATSLLDDIFGEE